jgi:hypothetical protein
MAPLELDVLLGFVFGLGPGVRTIEEYPIDKVP